MVSNLTKMTWITRHLLFLSFLLLSNNIYSQDISKHYTSSTQEDGTLYYVLPQKGFKNNKIKSELIYDLTYLTSNETILLNFSYFDKSERKVDSIALFYNNQKATNQVKTLFVKADKKQWHYRYSSELKFVDMDDFLNQTSKPKIILYTQDEPIELLIKQRAWKKQSSILKKISTMIKYNQQ